MVSSGQPFCYGCFGKCIYGPREDFVEEGYNKAHKDQVMALAKSFLDKQNTSSGSSVPQEAIALAVRSDTAIMEEELLKYAAELAKHGLWRRPLVMVEHPGHHKDRVQASHEVGQR